VRETILRSVRALQETIDDAATVPLAILAREYLRKKKNPDAFFRGTIRLLTERYQASKFRKCAHFLTGFLVRSSAKTSAL
jgi:hypothetical protein